MQKVLRAALGLAAMLLWACAPASSPKNSGGDSETPPPAWLNGAKLHTLAADGEWHQGELEAGQTFVWFETAVIPGDLYTATLFGSGESSSYSLDAKMSILEQDHETYYLAGIGSSESSWDIVIPPGQTKIYVMVSEYSYSNTEAGTFALKWEHTEMADPSFAAADPTYLPTDGVFHTGTLDQLGAAAWYRFSVVPGKTYSVQKNGAGDTNGLTGYVKLDAFEADGTTAYFTEYYSSSPKTFVAAAGQTTAYVRVTESSLRSLGTFLVGVKAPTDSVIIIAQ